ncbi:hypothetical protein GUJ93_ZPchr0009g2382 [Zizania palustris]|uniref:Uncharacterized protein n=1 Tax=Zizania palustris TaxID=103762 RepID=A0A8J5S6D9_ZIZPA|nr:hypothetical protein GUJ93_ZPchr0009g2382 [Zizania palustris]
MQLWAGRGSPKCRAARRSQPGVRQHPAEAAAADAGQAARRHARSHARARSGEAVTVWRGPNGQTERAVGRRRRAAAGAVGWRQMARL